MRIKTIFWDFDGVIFDSDKIRTNGFKYALRKYDTFKIETLVDYHRNNGGLSRYHKFQWFISTFKINDNPLNTMLEEYSSYMQDNLFDHNLLYRDALVAIRKLHEAGATQYIVSGSDQKELRSLVEYLHLNTYFKGVYGSPSSKFKILSELGASTENGYFIGDTINDFNASKYADLTFVSCRYKNETLDDKLFVEWNKFCDDLFNERKR